MLKRKTFPTFSFIQLVSVKHKQSTVGQCHFQIKSCESKVLSCTSIAELCFGHFNNKQQLVAWHQQESYLKIIIIKRGGWIFFHVYKSQVEFINRIVLICHVKKDTAKSVLCQMAMPSWDYYVYWATQLYRLTYLQMT